MNVRTDYTSPNFSSRFGITIRAICMHTTEGTDSRSWLCNPSAQVSAHYLVQRSIVYRLVSEDDAAWHAGRIVGTPTTPLYDGTNPNLWTVGIEMEGFADRLLDGDTLNATAELIRDIRVRLGPLPLVNHGELSPGDRHDPGAQNRAALDALLEDDMDGETVKNIIREMLSSEEGANLVKQEILRSPNGYGVGLQKFLDENYVRRDGK